MANANEYVVGQSSQQAAHVRLHAFLPTCPTALRPNALPTKRCYFVAALDVIFKFEVKAIATNPPPVNPYSAFKEALIKRLDMLQEREVRRLPERDGRTQDLVWTASSLRYRRRSTK